MTLSDLVRKARAVGNMFNSYEVPLLYNEKDVNVSFDISGSNGDYKIIMSLTEKE